MRRGCIGLVVASAVSVLALMIGWPLYWQHRHLNELHDPVAQKDLLAENFEGFQCNDATVLEVLEPEWQYFNGGVRFAMSEPCRTELLARAKRSTRFRSYFDENCFSRDGSGTGFELCIENNSVYFGAIRVG